MEFIAAEQNKMLSLQFFCKSKIILKNKVFLKKA